MRARASPRLWGIAIMLVIACAVTNVRAEDSVFADGFESGDLSGWTSVQLQHGPVIRLATGAASIEEGDAQIDLLVTLSEAVNHDVAVEFVTTDGAARADEDYTVAGGSLTIPAGQLIGTIPVLVFEDGIDEDDEDFTVGLTDATGTSLGSPHVVTVTIVDNDDEVREPASFIGEPTGRLYGSLGEQLTMDARLSSVPHDWETWFAVLVDDGGSGPFWVKHLASGFVDTFQTSPSDPRYRVRLVIATPAWMPDDSGASQLRMPDLPCTYTGPGDECDSTEIVLNVARHGVYPFEHGYVLPEAVLLKWKLKTPTFELERSEDNGTTWTPIDRAWDYSGDGTADRVFVDRSVPRGQALHYRARRDPASEWIYLGNTLLAPGGSVTTPFWDAPRPVPEFESVQWDCPDAASRFLCPGTVTVRLEPEPGETLDGTTIRVFLNEDTFEATDRFGDPVPILTPDTYPFSGRDEPGCVVRKGTPDLEVAAHDGITLSIPGVHYGANSFRFEIDDGQGGYAERALLYGIHDTVGEYKASYRTLQPLLFSYYRMTESFTLEGLGPVSRNSPDCLDGDGRPPYDRARAVYNAKIGWWYDWANAWWWMIEETDSTGRWSMNFSGPDRPLWPSHLPIENYPCTISEAGQMGRSILAGDGSPITLWETAQQVCGHDRQGYGFEVDTTKLGPHPPWLRIAPENGFSVSDDEIDGVWVKFRIEDLGHDVIVEDPRGLDVESISSVTVTNTTLVPEEKVYAWYGDAGIQGGGFGLFVAEVPMLLPTGSAAFPNQLEIHAVDEIGNEMTETISVNRKLTAVVAEITSVNPPTGIPEQPLIFDASASIVPDLGVEGGGVAKWVFFSGNESGWSHLVTTGFLNGPEGLISNFPMPQGRKLKARLVVAEDEDSFPSEPYPLRDGEEIPCRWRDAGVCDTAEVVVDMTDPDCYDEPELLDVNVVEPAGATVNITTFDELALRVTADTAGDPVAYRWVVYDAQFGIGTNPITYLGQGGNDGWSELNQELSVTPADQGLQPDEYLLVAEARSPILGCSDPDVDGWSSGRSPTIHLNIGPGRHTIDGVAPGQVVEGGTFRVYSRSLAQLLTPGELAVVLIDDDSSPYDDTLLEYQVPITAGGFFEILADPQYLQANGGTSYFVWVAEDQDWLGLSSKSEIRVERPGSTERPNIVEDEESSTCTSSGVTVNAECAHPILPGQTWLGEWGEADDSDYFTFVAGAGTEVRVALQRADTSLPPQHPEAPTPEVLVARPDGLVYAVSDPLPIGASRTSVDTVLAMDGRYFVIVRTPRGSGPYLVNLEKLADGSSGAPAFGYTKSRAYLATSSTPGVWFRTPVFDGFGNPISGVPVEWEEGVDCGDGSFCGSGHTEFEPSGIDGMAEFYTIIQPGAPQLWQPSAMLPIAAGAAKVAANEARNTGWKGSLGDDPILGRINTDGLAVTRAELPNLEAALAIRDKHRLLTSLGDAKRAKEGLSCNAADMTCPDSDAPVFTAAQLLLDPGQELVDIQLEILADGQAVDILEGEEVVTGVPLLIEATACVRDGGGVTCDVPIDGPIAVLVTQGHGAALEQDGATCGSLSASPGNLTYRVGRNAVMRFNHIDGNNDPCCWLPMEWIDAVVVANVMTDDGQGGLLAVSKRAETTLESSPRPAAACEIRRFPPGPFSGGLPEIGGFGAHPLAEGESSAWQNVGSVYVVDGCGNLEHPGANDEMLTVVSTTPADPEIWIELQHAEGHWEWQMLLHSTHSYTDGGDEQFFIPSGTYTTDLAIDGATECSGGSVTFGHTVDYGVDRPTIQLVWMQQGSEPETPGAAPESALRHDQTGEVIAWRVRPAESDSGWNGGTTIYGDVPVRVYVAEDVVTFDLDGNVQEHMRKVEDAEICVGEAYKFFDPIAYPAPGSDVTTVTCDRIFVGETEVSAYTEPEWWAGGVFEGPIGITAGVVRAPGQPGDHYLVAEPLDEAFRRGDSWRIDQDWCSAESGSCIGTFRKDFTVLDREDPTDLSCSRCEDCAGGNIGLRNGNVRYFDSDPLPGLPVPLAGRTYDSLNFETGAFGAGWTSAYDARVMAGTSKAMLFGGELKATVVDEVRVTTEDNRTFVFQSIDGGAYFQSWPEAGRRSRLNKAGADYFLELSGDPYRRTYRGSDGRMVELEEIATGRAYTISYDGATGEPAEVTDSWRGLVATFEVIDGLITGISTSAGSVSYGHGGNSTLDSVSTAGMTWRSYGYSGDDQLTEVSDGAGHLLNTYAYSDGLAATSISGGDSITAIEWGAAGPRLPNIGERVVRTDSAAGASTYYYLRRIAGKYRVVEIMGECACSGNDRVYAYDALGNPVLEQDGKGYITRREHLGDGRLSLDEMGLRLAACDPADFPEDSGACRLTVDELEALGGAGLEQSDAYRAQWYSYDDPSWPDRPTQMCRSSVMQLEGQDDRVACTSTTYDPTTGQRVTSTESGWTGQSAAAAVLEARTTSRTFYGGAFTGPAFDPGGSFESVWLTVAQPDHLFRTIDGPRNDVPDLVQFVYYPVVEVSGTPVPVNWRGRLAAEMDPAGNITRYDDYDEWGNARRIIGPTGIVTELTFDEFGRLLTRTLVGGEGCDPADDSLCAFDLVTTSTYGPGGGPIEGVTSPDGAVTEYSYDNFGRMLTTGRGPGPGTMLERMENEYDPITGLRIRDSRLAYESGTGWVEHSRTEYQHYLTGQLVLVERPRFAGDSSPSEEHYSYDVAGRIATVQDPSHTAPNVEYFYDPLGRLERVRQLLDPGAPPDEQWADTTYGYDSNGNLVAVTDANGNVTEYLVDDFGQTVRITSPVTGVTEMSYDHGGNLVTRIDARNVTSTSIYDANNRLTGITYDEGVTTEELSFTYDAAGRRTGAQAPGIEQTFTHSRRGLILTASQELGGEVHTTVYTYDLDGQSESVTYPSGRTITFTRDFAGRPTSISSVAPGGGTSVEVVENLEYLPFGPARHLELGPPAGHLTETRDHDWHYRRTSQQITNAIPTALLDLEYGYDASDNLTALTDHLGDRSAGYTYDDLSRLTSVTWADGNRAYEYDAIGNLERIGVSEGLLGEGEVILGYLANLEGNNSPSLESTDTYQDGSLLSAHTVLSDAIGNVTSDGLTSLSYDLENHLDDRSLKGATINYTYTADGRLARSARGDTGTVTDIVLDFAGRRLAKLEGGVWRDYVYLGDHLLAYFDDGAAEPFQVITDHIGMPMMAVDGTGVVIWQARSEPYGELRGEVGLTADPGLRYPGQWQDELDLEASCIGDTCTMPGPLQNSFSLFENGYRWYNPRWGRYTQSDPIGENPDDPRDFPGHPYLYGRANPSFFIDPLGLEECCLCPGKEWRLTGTFSGWVIAGWPGGSSGNFETNGAILECLSERSLKLEASAKCRVQDTERPSLAFGVEVNLNPGIPITACDLDELENLDVYISGAGFYVPFMGRRVGLGFSTEGLGHARGFYSVNLNCTITIGSSPPRFR